MKNRVFAAFFAVLLTAAFFIAAVPAFSLGASPKGSAGPNEVPAGYDEADYQKLLAFMEIADENGGLISENEVLRAEDAGEINVSARFGHLGDPNDDGSLDLTDALIVLRFAMGVTELPCAEAVCDMNGDGTVDMTDALLILRTAMGII